jgi:hypothetical protein
MIAKIPPGFKYGIERNHGVDPDTLQAMNPELAGRAHAIQVGEYVRVPRK